ncbi:MAG: HypC/HybG/HupF family hydrogenase formation chaperone [Candidatus Omnitrophica bacterium CG07_land_8_20_14_0_80_50_8]|nr:MAG: HypC/HybG/HupF family hydrogenase formation chaperone [Candidatus Omnitrophica bacterium CG07_land_8_20_14_0_80_50_8]
MCLAVPGQVIEISSGEPKVGKVDFGGIQKQVNLVCVPKVRVGDYVIVHVGFALNILDEVEAKKVFQYLKEIDELGEVTV